jgi:HD-GYP domain-containing protein (c-di-GMP phosphodiesterase class II)
MSARHLPVPEALKAPAAVEQRGVRRIPRIDVEQAAERLFAAMAGDGDPVSLLLAEVAALAGCTTAAIWRRDDRGRLLLVRKHGDDQLTASMAAGARTIVDETDDGGPVAGLPLELTRDAATGDAVRLYGRTFVALRLTDGVVALGPLQRSQASAADRTRLGRLQGLVDGAFRGALRSAALESELDALRREVELGRRAIGSTIDAARSLQLLVDLAITSTASSAGFVAIRDGEGFAVAAARDLPAGFDELDVTPGRGILAGIPGLPGLLIVDNAAPLGALGIGGLLAVSGPAGADRPTCIFGLVADDGAALAADCAPLLETLIEQAALVLESAGAARATAHRHIDALRGLCRALDARSPELQGHHPLVAGTARAIAVDLGLDPDVCDVVADAALVHDAGLLAASVDAPLAGEFAHPALGADMAALVPGAADLAPLIRAHHEWWDGFGFPQGLSGEAIPIGARILAAAECYAELLQPAGALTSEQVRDEIRARRGTQLDPACADTLVALLEEDL